MKKSTLTMTGYIIALVLVAVLIIYGKDIWQAIMDSLHTESMLDQILR